MNILIDDGFSGFHLPTHAWDYNKMETSQTATAAAKIRMPKNASLLIKIWSRFWFDYDDYCVPAASITIDWGVVDIDYEMIFAFILLQQLFSLQAASSLENVPWLYTYSR